MILRPLNMLAPGPAPESERETPVRPKRVAVLVTAVFLFLLGPMLFACGAEKNPPTGTEIAPDASTADRPDSRLTPAQLGEAVGAAWYEAMQRLVGILESRPEPKTAYPVVAALKNEYVQKLVALGRQIARLQVDGKAVAFARISEALEQAADVDWFKRYVDLYNEYASGDQEFALLLASFNVLTQYADFELLKIQDPQEAARLGID